MNKVSLILLLAVLSFAVNSCDFFRALAGRPGSAEITGKRLLIERAEARRDSLEQVRLDSIARVERYVADSLYAVDTLVHSGLLRNASYYKRIPREALDHRYYLVAGAFSQPANAERLAGRYRAAGHEAFAFHYTGSLTAVFVSPSNRIDEILEEYRAVMRLPFASKKTWVLVNE